MAIQEVRRVRLDAWTELLIVNSTIGKNLLQSVKDGRTLEECLRDNDWRVLSDHMFQGGQTWTSLSALRVF